MQTIFKTHLAIDPQQNLNNFPTIPGQPLLGQFMVKPIYKQAVEDQWPYTTHRPILSSHFGAFQWLEPLWKRSNFLINPFSLTNNGPSTLALSSWVRGASGTHIVSVIIFASTTIVCVIHLRQYFLIWINNVANLDKNISRPAIPGEKGSQIFESSTVTWWQQPVQTDRYLHQSVSLCWGLSTGKDFQGRSYLQDAFL